MILLRKLAFFLFCICFLSENTFSQTFEGKIVYKNTYTSNIPNVPDDQFNAMMGNTQEYLIKGGNYKSSTNGTMMQWQLYRSDDNRLYMKMSNSPTIFWHDGADNPDEVLKSEINKGVETIAGYLCDELVLTCKTGVHKYYFNSKLKVDPKVFEQHKFGNWSEVISRSKSLPLKISVETAQFTVESVATEVRSMELSSREFELPENSQLQKSPY